MAILQLLAIFIVVPWLAFVVSGLFFYLYHESHSRVVAATAGAWLLYGVYEYLTYLRILCTGECNIRVDLLLFYPLLAVLSVVALVRFFWLLRSRRSSPRE